MTTRSVTDASLTVISIFCALGVFASSIPAKAAPFPPITSFPFFGAVPQSSPKVQASPSDDTDVKQMPDRFRRQTVDYFTQEVPGTIVIDTSKTHLYFVLGVGKAVRYGIGVGRDGFRWSGVERISKKAEWPDWTPPPEMIARQPYLPRQMAGGPGNPLGAHAMYLGGTVYRIHDTNAPETIGTRISSGCIRLTNQDVADLYTRVTVGTKIVLLPVERHVGVTERSKQL